MRVFTLLLPVAAATVMAQSPDTAIRELVGRYVDAREKMDPAGTASLFTADADQLVSTGEWRRGREALVKGAMASSRQNEGKRTITVETVRALTPDVALADGRYEIASASGEPRRMWATFVCRRTAEGWRIAAIRNMLPSGRN
ncbi:MAG TPA: SgcJ/EcaC family oxidoreductase [Bryobacteraceae bacterium]|nr:SgcJ/EcaC family oxidoreductase [Bryobacteraceae bacterium]